MSTQTWGWIHMLLGILVLAAGAALFAGATWARAVAVIAASISLIGNLAWLPHYPVWGLCLMALDVVHHWGGPRPRLGLRRRVTPLRPGRDPGGARPRTFPTEPQAPRALRLPCLGVRAAAGCRGPEPALRPLSRGDRVAPPVVQHVGDVDGRPVEAEGGRWPEHLQGPSPCLRQRPEAAEKVAMCPLPRSSGRPSPACAAAACCRRS